VVAAGTAGVGAAGEESVKSSSSSVSVDNKGSGRRDDVILENILFLCCFWATGCGDMIVVVTVGSFTSLLLSSVVR